MCRLVIQVFQSLLNFYPLKLVNIHACIVQGVYLVTSSNANQTRTPTSLQPRKYTTGWISRLYAFSLSDRSYTVCSAGTSCLDLYSLLKGGLTDRKRSRLKIRLKVVRSLDEMVTCGSVEYGSKPNLL